MECRVIEGIAVDKKGVRHEVRKAVMERDSSYIPEMELVLMLSFACSQRGMRLVETSRSRYEEAA